MSYYLIAIGLLLHALYWGAGLAMLHAVAVASLLAGVGAVSRADPASAGSVGRRICKFAGTNSYAWWSELIPAVFVLAFLRNGVPAFRSDLARFGAYGWQWRGLVAVVTPLARAADFLTTISLGSCDAADYAAGARC